MDKNNPKFTLIRGALWSLGTRWSIKLAGFFNTLIMARLLLPSDYGIVAMSMLAVEGIHAFTDVGAETAILRIKNPSRDEVDSAWTLRFFQNVLVSLLLLAVASMAAIYFKEPRVQSIIWVLAVCMLFYGATNIGLTLAHKEFNFSVYFKVNVYSKVISVLVTLIAGILLKDYRALVLGIVSGYVSGAALSYVMHPYRPRINTKKIKEIWQVSKWLMVTSMGGFLLRRSDEVIASKMAASQDYGIYHVGADLGRLPVSELGPVMMRAFLPVLSSMQSDIKRTNDAVLKTLSAINIVTIPVGLGMAAVSVPLTSIVLGEKWIEAAPFVAIYAIVAAVQFISSPLITLLVLRGHTRIQSFAIWIEFIFFILFVFLLVNDYKLVGLAIARLIASILNVIVIFYLSKKLCGVDLGKLIFSIARPLIGAIGMSVFVIGLIDFMQISIYLELLIASFSGALVYFFWILFTWILFKKPEGLESTLLDFIKNKNFKY